MRSTQAHPVEVLQVFQVSEAHLVSLVLAGTGGLDRVEVSTSQVSGLQQGAGRCSDEE